MKTKGFKSNLEKYSDSSNKPQKSLKEIGKDIGGNPDDWDYKNLRALIDNYELAYPGRIATMAKDVKFEAEHSGRTKKYGEISKDSEFRTVFWLPEDLAEVIEAGYPSLWTNKKHVSWFIKCFPEFKRQESF